MLPREHYLKQTFQDAVNFPNGFEKGGLSDIQARLIRKQGTLVNALMQDEVSDPTSEDLHILKVVANQSAPKSPIEQAWVKYLSIVKAIQAATPAKTGKSKTTKVAKAPQDSNPELEQTPAKTVKKAVPEKAVIDKTEQEIEKKPETKAAKTQIKEKKTPAPKKATDKA